MQKRKSIDKEYLFSTLKDFDNNILNKKYYKTDNILQSDWNETNELSNNFIKNKPNLDFVNKFSESSDGKLLFNGNNVLGVDGNDGESAYDLAVKNGFVGTEKEWLNSLHGQNGDNGSDGFSPIIVENDENSSDIYKLDIITSSGKITTPNLKQVNAVDNTELLNKLGGLSFAQDSDGNYGYIISGTTEVIPFYRGTNAFEIARWYCIDGERYFKSDIDGNWETVANDSKYSSTSVGYSPTLKESLIQWAITIPQSKELDIVCSLSSANVTCDMEVNGELIKNLNTGRNFITLNLISGINTLALNYKCSSTGSTISITIPSVVY